MHAAGAAEQHTKQRLESTLNGFIAARSLIASKEERFSRSLAGFRAASEQEQRSHAALAAHMPGLLAGFSRSVEQSRLSQELTADEFNLLDVMRITGRETMHSAVLAWLLARSIGGPGIAGTHSQGALGFQLFIAQLSGFGLSPCYADQAYWVRTEVSGDTSRIDIEIACRGQFIIHIENKIWSGEGASQTSREWNDLNTRANELGIPDGRRHAIFLTPRGISATDGHFHPLSWSRVAGVFDGFSRHAKPEDVRLFCRHYAAALRRSIVQLDELKEIDDGKAAIQRD